MTGAEKFSLPIDNQGATVFDFDGDGTAEIAVNREGALVIGSVRDGTWLDRAHLGGYRLWQTGVPVAPQREGGTVPDRAAAGRTGSQAAAGLGTAAGRSGAKKAGPHGRVVTLGEAEGRPASLGLLRAKAGEPFTVTELPLDGAHSDLGTMQVLAATTDRLIVSTRDGRVRVMSANGHSEASWACGDPFVSRPAVADIDGDGANELVVCRAGGKVAAMRVAKGRKTPKVLWEADGSGLTTSLPYPYPTPLIADVHGDGRRAILVTGNGTRLLDHRGKTLWRSDVAGARATFGDFNGDGHSDVYLAAWTAAHAPSAQTCTAMRWTGGRAICSGTTTAARRSCGITILGRSTASRPCAT